jgi:hypothetical protein
MTDPFSLKGEWIIEEETGDLVYEFRQAQKSVLRPRIEKANLKAPDLIYLLSLSPSFDEEVFVPILLRAARKAKIKR